MEYKYIIFDLDGTLVDTAPDIINCLKQSFEEVLQLTNINIDRNIIGPPVSDMIKQLKPELDSKKVEVLTNAFRVCYDDSIFPETFLYKGVAELLKKLKKKGCGIYLATNKPISPTKKILSKLKINFFNKVVTADMLGKNKLTKSEMINFLINNCRLDANKSLMIGDTRGDIDAARENDISSAAVVYGYGDRVEIALAKPKFIFEDLGELFTILNKDKEKNDKRFNF
jgi:phosphoglycolate phosphatase